MRRRAADLRAALRGLAAAARCALLPTPLEPAPRLGARLGVDLAVKREDLSGLGQGGNKARQVEVLLAEAIARGCRGRADHGERAVELLPRVRRRRRGAPRPALHPAAARRRQRRRWTAICCSTCCSAPRCTGSTTADPYDPAVLARLQALAAGAGAGAQIVQLPGEAGPLAAAAAASLALELAEQCAAGSRRSIWLAAGSGLTAAGLALGCEALGLRARVQVISVQQQRGFIEPRIRRRAEEAARLLGLDVRLGAERLVVDDGWLGPGYGQPSRPALDAVVLAARLEGWMLDPVYAGKALAALIAAAEAGELAGERVVFVCSGGAPALFAHGAALARHIAEPA